jgi:hypothetical protein
MVRRRQHAATPGEAVLAGQRQRGPRADEAGRCGGSGLLSWTKGTRLIWQTMVCLLTGFILDVGLVISRLNQ